MTIASTFTASFGAPLCPGITTPALALYPTTVAVGREMVDIPGGLTVIGSGVFEYAVPRWVDLSPYASSVTAENESQYREVMGKAGNADAPANHPVTFVSWNDAQTYLKRLGGGLDLLTEAQWENAARGPAVDMRKVMEMETGRFTPSDFVDFAAGRYENFVLGVLGQIFTDPTNELFQRIINRGAPFFGWRMYGTVFGKLTKEEAWYDQKETAPVNWGLKNAYGLYGMTGGVWEWVKDAYSENPTGSIDPFVAKGDERAVRGGSWGDIFPEVLRAAYHSYFDPDCHFSNFGFRVGAPQSSPK